MDKILILSTGGADVEHSRRRLDLTGWRFGRLTVLAPAGRIGRYTAWLCRCECGRETVATTRKLRGGNTRSCGCLKPDGIPHPTYIDGASPETLAAAKIARSNDASGVALWRAGAVQAVVFL